MKLVKLALCGLLAAGLAFAQDRDSLEIRGIVRESGLNTGVADAEISVYQFSKTLERTVFATGTTDPQGNFRFHPTQTGNYYVEAKKPSYVATTGYQGPDQSLPAATGTLVSLSHDRPEVYVRLVLMRLAELNGRVIDEDDKPVEGVSVEALDDSGLQRGGGRMAARTNRDGSFRIRNLPPGQYVVRVSGLNFRLSPPATKFSAEEMNIVGLGFGISWWPGVQDASAAGKVTIVPGTPTDLGTLRVRKEALYRMQISLRGCRPGDDLRFSMIAAGRAIAAFGPMGTPEGFFSSFPSCDDILVRDLPAGLYEFALQSKQAWAVATVELSNKNEFVTIAMIPEADVTASVIAAHESTSLPALDRLQVQLRAIPSQLPGTVISMSRFSGGKFWFQRIRGPRHAVIVNGLSSGYYVKEIRSNGVAAPEGIITLGPGSSIEVVIDDQPATLTGAVTDSGQPANQPKIYVTPWPEPSSAAVGMDKAPSADGDKEGRFQLAGLPPGEYRVLALPLGPIPDGHNDWTITPQLWDRAEEITLERGKQKEITLTLTDPFLQ